MKKKRGDIYYLILFTLMLNPNKSIASKESYQPLSPKNIDINIYLKTSKSVRAKIIKLIEKNRDTA